VKGVVAAMLMVSSLSAYSKPTESLGSLFDDVEGDSFVPSYSFIDLESFFEDFPEAAEEFKKLSDEKKEKLLESVDLFNDAFSKAMMEVLASIEGLDQSQKSSVD
jgi:hypothetical protein